jgi:hypothetical protein
MVLVELRGNDVSVSIALSSEEAQRLLTAIIRCESLDIYTSNHKLRLCQSQRDGELGIEISGLSEDGTESLRGFVLAEARTRTLEALRFAMAPTAQEVAQKERAEVQRREREQAQAAERHAQRERERADSDKRQRKEAAARVREQQKCERERVDRWHATYGQQLVVPPVDFGDDDELSSEFDGAFASSYANKAKRVPVARRLAIWSGGRVTIASGAPSAMKTLTCLGMGIAVSIGESSALGGALPIEMHGFVVYLDFENPGGLITELRCQRLGGDCALHNCYLDILSPSISLCDANAETLLTRLLYGVAVCVVDSLQHGCRYKSEQYSEVLAMLGRVSKKTGTAIIVIVHPVKDWARREGLQRLDFITGREVDTALWFTKDPQGVLTIESIKNANGKEPIEPLRVRLVDGDTIDPDFGEVPIRFEEVVGRSHKRGSKTKRGASDAPTAAPKGPGGRPRLAGTPAERIVGVLGSDGPLGYEELLRRARGRRPVVARALKELVRVGLVVNEGGTYSLPQ